MNARSSSSSDSRPFLAESLIFLPHTPSVGSRDVVTGSPASHKADASNCTWVVLPAPSMPSTAIRIPGSYVLRIKVSPRRALHEIARMAELASLNSTTPSIKFTWQCRFARRNGRAKHSSTASRMLNEEGKKSIAKAARRSGGQDFADRQLCCCIGRAEEQQNFVDNSLANTLAGGQPGHLLQPIGKPRCNVARQHTLTDCIINTFPECEDLFDECGADGKRRAIKLNCVIPEVKPLH